MPPFLRTFIVLMIRFPGSVLRFLGGFGALVSFGFLLMGSFGPKCLLIFLGCLAAMLIGHLMKALAGQVLGEADYRMAADQIGQRLAWDLAIDALWIALPGAGLALAANAGGGNWLLATATLLLFAGLFYLLHLASRKREAFLDRWVQEHADDLRPPS